MSIWLVLIPLLLQILPILLKWLMNHKGELKQGQLDKLNNIVWYTDQIQQQAVVKGAKRGGVEP